MRFKLSANVRGLTTLSEDVSVKAPGREYFFHRGDGGYLGRIDVIADVDNPELFYGGGIGYGQGVISISPAYDPVLRDQIIAELQQLESLLGFDFHIERINWLFTRFEIIDITEEEQTKVGLSSCGYSGPQPRDQHASAEALHNVIAGMLKYGPLTDLLSFFREGKNEYMDSRFINSFHNCYYVVEGLYGRGKSDPKQVKQRLVASHQAVTAFNAALKIMGRSHRDEFNEMATELSGSDGTF